MQKIVREPKASSLYKQLQDQAENGAIVFGDPSAFCPDKSCRPEQVRQKTSEQTDMPPAPQPWPLLFHWVLFVCAVFILRSLFSFTLDVLVYAARATP